MQLNRFAIIHFITKSRNIQGLNRTKMMMNQKQSILKKNCQTVEN